MFVRVQRLVFVVLLCAVAGCAGTSAPSPGLIAAAPTSKPTTLPTSMPSAMMGSTGTASVTISLNVTAGTSATRARASYFSEKTESIGLYVTAVNGVAPSPAIYTIINTGGSTCSVTSSAVSCTVSVAAPIGKDTFSVRTYAQQNGITQPISIGTTTAPVVANQTTNLAVTFLPVVSSLSYTLTPSATTPINAPATFTLSVTAKDVAGATIGGTDPYYSPITVSSADTGGHVTASPALPASLTAPGQTVTFSYDGAGSAASYVFAVAVPGDLASGSLLPQSVAITFTSSAQHLYVTQQSVNAVYVYDIGSDGSITGPSRTIQGSATGLSGPSSIFVDKLGALYVTNQFTNVTVYAPGANGNVAPTNTLAAGQHPVFVGPNGDTSFAIIGQASSSTYNDMVLLGSIYQTSVPNGARPVTGTSFMSYGLNSYSVAPTSGTVPTPEACSGTIDTSDSTGVSNVLCFPNPISVDSQGNANGFFNFVTASPANVKFRPDGLLTVANQGSYYAPGANVTTYPEPVAPSIGVGSTTPVYTLAGSNTGFQSPGAIAFDTLGNMYVADYGLSSGAGTIRVFPMNATGNVAPTRTIGGFTYLDGIAVGP